MRFSGTDFSAPDFGAFFSWGIFPISSRPALRLGLGDCLQRIDDGATGTNTTTATVTIDRPSATVSASALALHHDCSRTYIGKVEA